MFIKTISVASVLIGLVFTNLLGCSTSYGGLPIAGVERQTTQALSVDDHLRLADSARVKLDKLEGQIDRLQTRIDKFKKKPYLDTKGFKGQGLRRLKGTLANELREVENKVAWHQTQAKELRTSQEKDHKDS